MKYSNIPWVGNIPKDWSICRFKDVSLLYNGNSIKDEEKDNYTNPNNAYPYIATKDIDVTYQSVNYNNGLYTKKYDSAFKIACADSSLMCIEGGSAGKKKAYLQHDVSFVNKLCCVMPKCIYGKYLFYYICSPNFEIEFNKFITGLIGGVSISTIKNFDILLPPEIEQQKIASFLDKKCAEIDEMIAVQEKIVEKLKAYKQSVITEAVTKGLNPDVPMKYSGIEWIGEIPEHWEVGRMKNVCSQNPNSLSEKTDNDLEFDYVDIGSVSFEKGVFNTEHYKFSEAPSRARRKANFGDFIMSTVRTYLRAIDVIDTQEKANYIYSTGFAVLTPKAHISYKFLSYISKSQYFLEQVTTLSRGINYPSINSTDLMTICVAYPSIEEQIPISEYLDDKCTEIDNLISIKLSKIDSLKEYKKSIIYEYVTGKKEVIE